ncbi:MAG: hypothetical protein JEZ00_21285 [Anaerolineaceae bacterium]|nr:hypothetical protein [Anaerolineaceae bacterium]
MEEDEPKLQNWQKAVIVLEIAAIPLVTAMFIVYLFRLAGCFIFPGCDLFP